MSESTKTKETPVHHFVQFLKSWTPVSRRRYEAEVLRLESLRSNEHDQFAERSDRAQCIFDQRLVGIQSQHEKEIEKTASIADDVVSRCSQVHFDHKDDHHYSITMTFSPRAIFNNRCGDDGLDFVAKRFAITVERKIRNSNFIEPPTRRQEY